MARATFVQIDGWVLNLGAIAWFEVKGLGDEAVLTLRCVDGSEHVFTGQRAAAAARNLVDALAPERWDLPPAKPSAPADDSLPPVGPEGLEWEDEGSSRRRAKLGRTG